MRGIIPPRLNPRRGQPKPISDVMGELLQGASFSRRSVNEEIAAAWEQVVGPEVASHARVTAFRGNVVHVEVDSAAWLHELAGFHRAAILEELRGRLRKSFVKDLKFKQAGSRPSPQHIGE